MLKAHWFRDRDLARRLLAQPGPIDDDGDSILRQHVNCRCVVVSAKPHRSPSITPWISAAIWIGVIGATLWSMTQS